MDLKHRDPCDKLQTDFPVRFLAKAGRVTSPEQTLCRHSGAEARLMRVTRPNAARRPSRVGPRFASKRDGGSLWRFNRESDAPAKGIVIGRRVIPAKAGI